MDKKILKKALIGLLLVLFVALIAWRVFSGDEEEMPTESSRIAAVEVRPVEQGPIEERRTFSGSLEATAEFVVAPKISGRIESITVDIADLVERGQVVARLDDDEYVQEVAAAEAELSVAEANLTQARNGLEIAERELGRISALRERGVSSEAQFDVANAEYLSRQAQLAVAEAQLIRAQSALETTRIRRGYAAVEADWSTRDDTRVVAERYVDEGHTVSANEPLFLIVELDPITGVIFVTERDYTRLREGQPITLSTDAFPGEQFEGRVARVAPVFRTASRQARVEIEIPNEDYRLKPGMFIRATVVLDRVEDATVVPRIALTRRNDTDGVFLLSDDHETVVWRPVELGVGNSQRVQVKDDALEGWVVTLGQNLVEDGSPVALPEGTGPEAANGEAQ